MSDSRNPDWDPTAATVLRDQPAAYDDLRRRCPVAWSEQLGWSLFRHEDVTRVLEDHETFSNKVSKHRSVPNGMDPPEHTAYRAAIEPCFSPDRMNRFEPVCRSIAAGLLEPLVAGGSAECMEEFAVPFALRCQCEFLGWPSSLAEPIRNWGDVGNPSGVCRRSTSQCETNRSHAGAAHGPSPPQLQLGHQEFAAKN